MWMIPGVKYGMNSEIEEVREVEGVFVARILVSVSVISEGFKGGFGGDDDVFIITAFGQFLTIQYRISVQNFLILQFDTQSSNDVERGHILRQFLSFDFCSRRILNFKHLGNMSKECILIICIGEFIYFLFIFLSI